MKLAQNTIKNIGHEANANYDSPVDKCFQISTDIKQKLERLDVSVTVRELRIGQEQLTHFVNTLPMSEFNAGPNTGTLLIDGSISQFSFQNHHKGIVDIALDHDHNLPKTAIYPPGAEERLIWYSKPNTPTIDGKLTL